MCRHIGGDSRRRCAGHHCLRHSIRRLRSLHSQVRSWFLNNTICSLNLMIISAYVFLYRLMFACINIISTVLPITSNWSIPLLKGWLLAYRFTTFRFNRSSTNTSVGGRLRLSCGLSRKVWLQSIRYFHGLRGIFSVFCGSLRLENRGLNRISGKVTWTVSVEYHRLNGSANHTLTVPSHSCGNGHSSTYPHPFPPQNPNLYGWDKLDTIDYDHETHIYNSKFVQIDCKGASG